MDDRQKLAWVCHNRQTRHRTRWIGELTTGLLAHIRRDGFDAMLAAAEALSGQVDDNFRRYCRVGGVQNRTLLIHVLEPAMISAIQRLWSKDIKEKMRQTFGQGSITTIVFRFGREGVYIPPAS